MRKAWLLWAALLIPLLMGGRSTYVGVEQRKIYNGVIRDNSITAATDYAGPCSDSNKASTSGDATVHCYVQEGYRLMLQRFSVNVAVLLGANEQCELVLETSSTGSDLTGTDVTSSSILIGAANTNAIGTCLPTSAVTLTARGEGCVREIDPTDANATIAGGGWFRVNINQPGGLTCIDIRDVRYEVTGLLIEGA